MSNSDEFYKGIANSLRKYYMSKYFFPSYVFFYLGLICFVSFLIWGFSVVSVTGLIISVYILSKRLGFEDGYFSGFEDLRSYEETAKEENVTTEEVLNRTT